MPSSYPSGLDALQRVAAGDSMQSTSHSGLHNSQSDAIEAIQTVLGLSPQGGSATVGARCAALESGKASLSGSVSFGGTVGGTGLSGSLLSSASPVMNGTAAAGTATVPSRQDHVHPSDTSKASLSGATFTGDVTVSKASATLSVSASTTTTSSIYIDNAAAGSYGRFLFRVSGSRRWDFGRDGTAESGSNAGSNFYIASYDDASASIGTPLKITRSTGKITAGSVGATAGIEYGASGPRDMVGTGSPEGVVTAPVGSTWRDTNATTGAIKWIKATGTGNTGWAVEYGDTGWRNITVSHAPNANGWAASLQRIRRVGATVQYVAAFENTSGTTATGAVTGVILPTGMRTSLSQQFYVATNSSSVGRLAVVESTGDVNLWGYSTVASFQLSLSWATADAWPTSLPGIPA